MNSTRSLIHVFPVVPGMPSTSAWASSTSFSTTSVNIPSIGLRKLGSSSLTMTSRWKPPGRASMCTLSYGTEKPTGPNH